MRFIKRKALEIFSLLHRETRTILRAAKWIFKREASEILKKIWNIEHNFLCFFLPVCFSSLLLRSWSFFRFQILFFRYLRLRIQTKADSTNMPKPNLFRWVWDDRLLHVLFCLRDWVKRNRHSSPRSVEIQIRRRQDLSKSWEKSRANYKRGFTWRK